jgi:C_GCAxxG_C_C family probable redox protein
LFGDRNLVTGYSIEYFFFRRYDKTVKKIDIAGELFGQGFNCAQSLLAAYGPDLGVKRDIALKLADAFGGGISRTGETCGAVIGALMIIGLRYGSLEPPQESKKALYMAAERFIEKFKSRNRFHSIVCSELIGFRIHHKKELNQKENSVIKERCPQLVQDAAEVIEEILNGKTQSSGQ